MNHRRLLSPLFFIIFGILFSTIGKSQTSTMVFDYDVASCSACGDSVIFTSVLSDSFTDATSTSKFLSFLEVRAYLFTCTTDSLELWFNGQKVSSAGITSKCFCGACDSIAWTFGSFAVQKFYNYGGKNYFQIRLKSSSTIYVDRIKVISTLSDRFDYDAGVTRLDTPGVRVCSGSTPIRVEIANFGRKSFSTVDVEWTWNGASQSGVTYSSKLDSVSSSGIATALVTLGTKSVASGQTDTLVVWTEDPGGQTDSAKSNDTLRVVLTGAYSDTLTVGGSSPDFASLTGALSALSTYGICGPTVLQLRPGTYSGQFVIGGIPGSSSVNTVTILSSTLDSSDVVLTHSSSSSSANYTLALMNTAHIFVRHITIEALGTTYGTCVNLSGNLRHVGFTNCRFVGVSTTSSSTSRSLVYRSYIIYDEITDDIQFDQCLFASGSYGLFLSNAYGYYANGYQIINNQFVGQYYNCIYLYYHRNTHIHANHFSFSGATGSHAVRLYYSNEGLSIRDNRFISGVASYNLLVSSHTGTSGMRGLISNNFFSTSASSTYSYYANVYLSSCQYVDFVHNNIYRAEDGTEAGLIVSYGDNNRIFNNIISCVGTSPAYSVFNGGTPNVSYSDHNNYHYNGSILGGWSGVAASNLMGLQMANGMDSNSVSSDPHFVSSANLSPYNVDLDAGGMGDSRVPTDIFGMPRDSVNPDIGAVEFDLLNNDAGLIDISRFTVGAGCFEVVLRNFGNDTLKSVTIGWTMNGSSKTPVSWTGSLPKGDTAHICLDTATFSGSLAYNIKAWTSSPNSVTDSFPSNDTISNRLFAALSGDYTLGGGSSDFVNFDSAVAALNRGGVIDSARFLVQNGTYTGQITLGLIDGADQPGAIIFQGASGDSSLVVLSYSSSGSSNNYVVQLDAARGVTFRHISLFNGSPTYKRVIYFNGTVQDILFEHCSIRNIDTTSTSSIVGLVYGYSVAHSNVGFINNFFENGSTGLYLEGGYNARGSNTRIHGNTFRNQNRRATQIYYQDNMSVRRNYVYSMRSSYSYGMEMYDLSGATYIDANQLYIDADYSYAGLYISYYYDQDDTAVVSNNFVSIRSTTTSSGMEIYSLSPGLIAYNSIWNRSTDSSSDGTALYLDWGDLFVYNNNLYHTMNGYALYLDDEDDFVSDHNNLFTNGSKIVHFDGTDYNTLAAYQSGESQDANSVRTNPQFVSTMDLHASSVLLNAKGKALSLVNWDIDGEPRDSVTPDIGADEFSPPAKDASVTDFVSPGNIVYADTMEIIVAVQNFGLDTLSEVSAAGKIVGGSSTTNFSTVKVTKTIAPGDTVHIRLGTFIFQGDTAYMLSAWSLSPGGVADQKPSNDTLVQSDRYAAMAGVYTIGGSSPDFPTFKAAINALNRAGIADTVIFKVRSGTYTERLDLVPVAGVFGRHSIIFESESKDSSAVTVQYTANASDTNWVVHLDGVDGITFRHLTIRSSSTSSYARVIRVGNGALNNTIAHCYIEGRNVSSTSSNYTLIYSENSADHGLWILNNRLRYGSRGIYISDYQYNPTYSGSYGVRINNNIINTYGQYGIYCYYADSIEIIGNEITSDVYSSFYGIYIEEAYRSLDISRNKITLNRGYVGIYMYDCGYNASTYQKVSNNFLAMLEPSNSGVAGIYSYYSDSLDLSYNSINITSSQPGYGIYKYSGTGNRIFNNNIDAGVGRALYIYYGTQEVNYNNLHSVGTNFGQYFGTDYTDLASWQSGTGLDSNSQSFDPVFISNSDLHTKDLRLNGMAMPLANILTDIDGESRDTVTSDIGADEYIPPALDAGIADIVTPKMPFLADTQNVIVILRNYGSDTLKSVTINWVLNDSTYPAKSWTGALELGDTAWVTLGSHVFEQDSAYSFKSWTSAPNSGTDALAENDTAEVKDQYPALSGIYTVGGGSPDFNTIEDVLAALTKGGVYDSARFDLRSGTYTGQFEFGRYLGANKKNALIFQSELKDSSKVFIAAGSTSSSKNYSILLDSASGITFRHLTLTTPGVTYSNVVRIDGGSENICFDRCHITGSNTNSTSTNRSLIYIYSANGNQKISDIDFRNSSLQYGSYGIYAYGYHNSGLRSESLNLFNNSFTDQYYAGVQCSYFTGNTIDRNVIQLRSSPSSSGYGVYLQYCDRYSITGNHIHGVPYMPLRVEYSYGQLGDTMLIANNMLSANGTGNSYGLYVYGSSYLHILHNNIRLSTSNSSSYGLYIGNTSYYGVLNNNFVHVGAGYAAYYSSSSSSYPVDHNNYYSNGTYIIYRGGSYTTFAAYQSGTGVESNGLNVDPLYLSSTDLHVRDVGLDGSGKKFLHLVPLDFDGEVRDSSGPDIGADEFSIPSADDAGIVGHTGPVAPFSSGSNAVLAVIRNFGSDTLKSATIHWSVNGGTASTYSWTGSLATYELDTVTIGNSSFTDGVFHTIRFWTTQPNGVADTINYNDTFEVNNLIPGLSGTYTVGGSSPDFSTISEAASALNYAGVLGDVIFSIRSGTYTESITLPPYTTSSPSNRVSFQSATGIASNVTWKPASGNSRIVYITGADNLSFRNMTFDFGTYYSLNAIELNNNSTGIEVYGNTFNMTTAYYYYYAQYGIRSSSDNDDSLVVRKNIFNNGYSGVYLYGNSSLGYEKGVLIDSNTFTGQYTRSIWTNYQNGMRIRANKFLSNSNSSTSEAIYSGTTSNICEIAYNTVTKTTAGSLGIEIYNHQGGVSTPFNVYNNFISVDGGTSTVYALDVISCSYVNLYFNSIHVYNGSVAATCLRTSSVAGMDIRNNIFSNSGTGYSVVLDGSTLAQSNYNDFYKTGTNLAKFGSTDYTTLSAFRTATGKDAQSLSVDPYFTSNTDLHTGIASLDSAGTPISGITDDIDGDTRNATMPDIGADEFNSLPNDLGIQTIINPGDACDQDTIKVKVVVFNFGSLPQSNFPIRYQLNGGAIDSMVVTDTIARGVGLTIEFDSAEILMLNTAYQLKVWTDLSGEQYPLNDTLSLSFTNYQKPDSVKSMVPIDGLQDVNYPVSLSWLPSSGATLYDVYIWDTATSKPADPKYKDLTQISVQITSGLTYGTNYYWQVVAKNTICSTPGKIQKFRMKYLPDLVVTTVTAPASAFSSTNFTVSWTVKNQGVGNSSGTWYDRVYLSDDDLYGSDTYLGEVQNPSAPNANGTYSRSATFTLPNGISGNYRIFILTDVYNQLNEANNTNNTTRDSATPMAVTLTPPPDLIVTSVIAPTSGFSGQSVFITYQVKNDGTGPTRSGQWYDRIYITTDSTRTSGLTLLKTLQRNGNLLVDSTYSNVSVQVTLPNNIEGKRFIVVHTDYSNLEYEYASENNNQNHDSLEVILTPPPDLVPRDVVIPDSASNREYITVHWNTINEGGTSTGRRYHDAVYLSSSPVLNTSTAYGLGTVYQLTTGPSDTAGIRAASVRIPNGITGKYYLFVVSDYHNAIEELSKESNNTSAADSIRIVSPDLVVRHVEVDSVDTTGHTTPVRYWVKNIGAGGDYQGSRYDSIYMHTSSTWSNAAKPIGRKLYTPQIASGDSFQVEAMVVIPDGLDGTRYFFVHTDATKVIYENGQDNNNRNASDSMLVSLAPYPDLIPQLDSFPDSSEAGELIKLQFNVRNDGDTQARANWRDVLYLSSDSAWGSSDLVLGTFNRTSDLGKGSDYDITHYPVLPSNMTQGTYYFIVRTDVLDQVYEHGTDNSNNTFISQGVYIDGYPPIDLKLSCPDIADTMNSGMTYVITYTVTNDGQAATASNFWTDVIYLSSDSVYSTNDQPVASYVRSGNLAKGASYTANVNVNIPNGTNGNYYVIVRIDTANRNVDVDLTSNSLAACDMGSAHRKVIKLTAPPDLKITSWTIPSTGTSGQDINIKYTVKNDGTGPTLSGAWVDKVYLSTDYTLDNGDYALGSHTHSGDLIAGGSYNVDKDFRIPIDKTGNYIVIIKTDVANVVYEHTNEGNNTSSSISTFSQPPPADLIVSQIVSPSTVLSGGTINVQWKVKNQGTNPAQGQMYDNVYLSKDQYADATDLLLGSEFVNISLGQNAELSRSKNYQISGVPIGYYYIVVSTDVRNSIFEQSDTNNELASFNQIYVDVPSLTIGTAYPDTLSDNEKLYYRFYVPDSLEGESLLITLKGDSTNGNNEMYLRYVELATASSFDQKHREPFQGNQEIILPETDTGTYYLHITGNVNPGSSQNIQVLIEVLPFEIRRVSPVSGGKDGEVTLKIEGSRFTENTEFYLGDIPYLIENNQIAEGEFDEFRETGTQSQVEYSDPTIAFATFPLMTLEYGKHDVSAYRPATENKESANTVKEDGFEVVVSGEEDVQVDFIHPATTRRNSLVPIKVVFTNKGNNDLVNKKITITSTAGAPIAFDPDGVSVGLTSLEITLEEPGGPPGRLRPDGSGAVTIYTYTSGALGFFIQQQ